MATKKTDNKKKKKKGGQGGVTYGPVGKRVRSGLTRGADLAKDFLPSWDDLYQFNPILDTDYGNMKNQLAALAGMDPSNMGAYAGNVSESLRGIQDQYKNAVGYSSDVQDIISRMKSGLEGYAAPELQAMREEQARQQQRALQTTMRNLENTAARSGLSGAAGSLQQLSAQNAANRARQELEQSLFIKNADEKQRRLGQYGGYITEQEAARQSRLGDYAGFTQGVESEAYGRGQQARSQYGDWLNNMSDRERQRQQLNALQQDKQKALQAAGVLGMSGLLDTAKNQDWTRKFMEEHPYDPRPVATAGGGGGYGPGFLEELNKLIGGFAGATGNIPYGSGTGGAASGIGG